ncbi:MAG: hypothetical protein FWF81_02635 [Defluviitaleaceae bacterium]|nr:hypothetical protein [Defluviitaleaceae bacterium]
MGAVEESLLRTEHVIAHAAAEAVSIISNAAEEGADIVINSNNNLLNSARAAAGGRVEAEQDVTRGKSDESREREHINEVRQTLETAKLEQLQAERDAQDEHFNELMSAQNLQMQALQTMLEGSQEDLITLLDSYNPDWRDAGRTFAEMLSAGIENGQKDVERQLQETMALLQNFQPTIQAPQIIGGTQLPDHVQGDVAAAVGFSQDTRFADDMRGILSSIQDTIGTVTQAIQQVARDTFEAFNNPLQAEFQGVRHMLDSTISAIHGIRSLLSEPRIVLTNNFHGVTAPDVPHLVDRQNTALLRALGAG